MTAVRYINDILRPSVLPYIHGLPEALFQQDNARPRTARTTMNFFTNSHVNLLPWPPRSPDLSPIEHVWDMMGVRISQLTPPPKTLASLQDAVQAAWDALPQADIDNLILSMPRRVAECLQGIEVVRLIINILSTICVFFVENLQEW